MSDKKITDVCPTCAGQNNIHVVGCAEAPVQAGREEDRKISEQVTVALTMARIEKALAATPINVALAALAAVVGRAQFAFQKDPTKRAGNLHVFEAAIRSAVQMEVANERAQQVKVGGLSKTEAAKLN